MKAEPACPHLTHTTATALWWEKAQVAPFIFNIVIFNNGNLCCEPLCPKCAVTFPCQWVVSWCQAEIDPLISLYLITQHGYIYFYGEWLYSRNLIFRLAHMKPSFFFLSTSSGKHGIQILAKPPQHPCSHNHLPPPPTTNNAIRQRAGSLVISCVKQSPRGKLLAAFNVKAGIVRNHFAGSLQSNSYSSCVCEPPEGWTPRSVYSVAINTVTTG